MQSCSSAKSYVFRYTAIKVQNSGIKSYRKPGVVTHGCLTGKEWSLICDLFFSYGGEVYIA